MQMQPASQIWQVQPVPPSRALSGIRTCLPQIPDANILAATASAPDMLMSLNAGKCDLVVTDQPTGKGALVAYPDFKMLEFGGGDRGLPGQR